jgi:hypothetical protein
MAQNQILNEQRNQHRNDVNEREIAMLTGGLAP